MEKEVKKTDVYSICVYSFVEEIFLLSFKIGQHSSHDLKLSHLAILFIHLLLKKTSVWPWCRK